MLCKGFVGNTNHYHTWASPRGMELCLQNDFWFNNGYLWGPTIFCDMSSLLCDMALCPQNDFGLFFVCMLVGPIGFYDMDLHYNTACLYDSQMTLEHDNFTFILIT
jgi:hypothetical protein